MAVSDVIGEAIVNRREALGTAGNSKELLRPWATVSFLLDAEYEVEVSGARRGRWGSMV